VERRGWRARPDDRAQRRLSGGREAGSAVIALLVWFCLSAFVVLLGAELNAEMEHQTAKDTTTGRPKPMGERGAFVADDLGQVP
jgi:hypothetical protein